MAPDAGQGGGELMDLRQILRGWFTPDEDGRTRPLQHASRDFQSGFDGAARNARQSAPVYVLNAMSRSGIPGWQGMARERNAEDARQLGLEAPGPIPVNDALRIALRDTLAPPADTQGYRPSPSPAFSTSAPETAFENREFLDARARAQEALREEGNPAFNDPAYQQSGQALAAAIDQNRADRAEIERRNGITWEQWWRHRGRQDANHETTPEDTNLLTRYRWGRAPDPYTGSVIGSAVGQRGAPIDMNRPIINNSDGSISTERTITIEADGRQYLIPTIVGGRQRTEEEAIQLWQSGQNPEVGIYGNASEAERAAQARSARIGRLRATPRR